jgi:small subunit ribosomal protein S7
MPRKDIKVDAHQVAADAVYGSRLLAKFINHIMLDGKRSTAEGLVYGALERVKAKSGDDDALGVFKRAIDNIRPVLEVKSRRVGGSTYQVPVEVYPRRRTSLAMRWLINAARSRGERGMTDKLCNELLDAASGRGSAVKKKEDTHRMAEANKAFAHYRW